MRAQNVAAKVFRVKTAVEAQSVIVDIIKSSSS
jgi:L-lactate dehydrogenase complex protein LldG